MCPHVDDRSLAAFRVGIACVVLLDQVQRILTAGTFLADSGVWPRALAVRELSEWRWSLHLANGTTGFQVLLGLATAAAAVCLALGWRTRLASVACWVLVASVHARNPYILNGGDTYLRCLLFWCMFVPLGRGWSLDRRAGRGPGLYGRLGTLLLVVQIGLVYVCSGLLKTHDAWRVSGSALGEALELRHLVRPAGRWLAQFEGLNRASTTVTLWLERVGPLLLFVPWMGRWARLPLCVMFMGFHAVTGLTMDLGLFPLVGIAAWAALLPGSVWDRFGLQSQETPSSLDSEGVTHLRVWFGRAQDLFLVAVMGMVLAWTGSYVFDRPGWRDPVRPAVMTLQLQQRWKMFAGRPARRVEWVVCRGVLSDGREFNALRPRSGDLWSVPQVSTDAYPSEHWRKYFRAAVSADEPTRWHALARWLQRPYGERATIEIYVMRISLRDDGGHQRETPRLVYRLGPGAVD